MNRPRIILIITLLFWLIVGGLVLRTNRLWFGPVTFQWSNITQPSAVFRWTSAPLGGKVVVSENSERSLKITVPKKFASGELRVATMPGRGVLTVNLNAPAGRTNTTASTPAGGVAVIPLNWDDIAVQTRTFNVDLLADAYPIEISAVTMTLQ